MTCQNFDPIMVSVAPTCWICSTQRACVESQAKTMTPETQERRDHQNDPGYQEFMGLVSKMTHEERKELLEYMKEIKAARSAANTQSGKAEQITEPVSVPILPENQNKDKGIYND